MLSKDSLVNRNARAIGIPSEVLGHRVGRSVVVAQAFPSWQLNLPNTSIANILERLRGPAQQALSRRPMAEPSSPRQGPQPEGEADAPPATFQSLGGNTAVLLDPKNDRLIYLVAAEGDDDNTTTEVRSHKTSFNTTKQP